MTRGFPRKRIDRCRSIVTNFGIKSKEHLVKKKEKKNIDGIKLIGVFPTIDVH